MKKLLCLVLALILMMTFAEISFADTTTVNQETYKQPPSIVEETAVESANTTLPKTGGIPEETFYAAGALIIVAALVVSIRAKTAVKR